MHRVFNCGYGMLVIVPPEEKEKIINKYRCHEIGCVVKREISDTRISIL